MINKKILLSFVLLFSLVLAINIVSAERTVNYMVRSAVIEDNKALTTSTNPVSGFDYVGYVCTNAACTTIGAQVAGLTGHSDTDILTAVFPTTLLNNNGYVIYLYKSGYIGWQQRNIIRYGDGVVNSGTAFYLSRKASGFSPIMNLSVVNEITPNKPLEVNVTTGIDADTYAAISNIAVAPIALNEQVNTTITLEIRNSQNQIVKTETRNVLIPYSGTSKVSFDHDFTSTGNYSINVFSDVTDGKIINSIRQSASANVRVISQNLTNYSYSIINNLVYNPQFPIVNQTVGFSLDVLSNYVDIYGGLQSLNTTLNTSIYRNGALVESTSSLVPGISNSTFSHFNFNRNFTEGNYTISVIARPNPSLGNDTVLDEDSLTFVVSSTPVNNQTNTLPVLTILSPLNGHTYDTRNILLNATSNQPVTWMYSLNGGSNVVFNPAITITANEGSNTLVIYGSNSNGTSSVSINFHVDTNDNNDDDDEEDKGTNDDDHYFSTLDSSNESYVIDLNKTKVSDYSFFKKFIYWLLILILVLLIIIVSLYILKFI